MHINVFLLLLWKLKNVTLFLNVFLYYLGWPRNQYLKLIPFPGILCGFVPVISARSQNLCILLLRINFKVFICSKFHKLFVYAVLQHRSQAPILVLLVPPHFSLLDMAILSALLCLLFPGGFSEYIRHTWQHSILLDQTTNMNFAPSWREHAYQVRS